MFSLVFQAPQSSLTGNRGPNLSGYIVLSRVSGSVLAVSIVAPTVAHTSGDATKIIKAVVAVGIGND